MSIPGGATKTVKCPSGINLYFKWVELTLYIWCNKNNVWRNTNSAEDHLYRAQAQDIVVYGAVSNILQQRESQYGSYSDVARITQAIKSQLITGSSYDKLSDEQKLSLDMIANKMARAVNGDVNYIDNWNDICGYSQLVIDNLKK